MAYVAPTVRSVGDAVTAADYNIMANDVIALRDSIVRLDTQTRTTEYTSTVTTIAGASDVFATDVTFTADGTSAYIVEFFCCDMVQPATNDVKASVHLVTGAGTGLGNMVAFMGIGNANTLGISVYSVFSYTPSAGSTSINIRGVINAAGTMRLRGGTGGSGLEDYVPTRLSVYGGKLT